MKIVTWKLLLLHSLLLYEVNCKEASSCNDTIISCGEGSVIAIANRTASIIPHLLEQCNARRECPISVMNGECFSILYLCKPDIPTLEIKPSSRPTMQFKPDQSAISFMSADYAKGKHQRAQNINCNITFSKRGKQTQNKIGFVLHDFAAYANSTELCLSVRDSKLLPSCSGSRECFKSYGSFDIIDKGQFSIILGENATTNAQVPLVRFWFEITVSPQNVHFDSVECLSKPAAPKNVNETGSSDKNNTNNAFMIIITSSGLGGCFLLTAVTLILVTVFWCRKSSKELKDEDAYNYIDLYSLNSRQDLASVVRDDDLASNISRASVAASMAASVAASVATSVAWRAEPMRPPLTGVRKASLPMNLELKSNDPAPYRKEENANRDPEPLQENESSHLAPNGDQTTQKHQDNAEFLGDTEYLEPIESGQQEENGGIASEGTENQDDALENTKRHDSGGSTEDLGDVENVNSQIQPLMKQSQHGEKTVSILNAYTSLETMEASGGETCAGTDSPYTTLDNITHAYRMKEMKRQDSLESPRKSSEEKACHEYLELLPDDHGTASSQDQDAQTDGVSDGPTDASN